MSKNPPYNLTLDRFKAKIVAVSQDVFVCQNDNKTYKAKKAFSCLVKPQKNDTVLLYQDDESLYITDILQRKESTHIDIVASSIRLVSESDITLEAKRGINGFAKEAKVVISEVSFLSQLLTMQSEIYNSVVTTFQGFIENLSMKNRSVTQQVEEHIELQCGSSRKVVKGSDIYSVKEQVTIADGQIKIDADQINMG